MKKQKNSRETNKSETKQQIIDAALELFAAKGYTATSLNDIISATGISKGSVYWHFHNKEDIFVQVISNSFDQWISYVNDELSSINDPIDKLKKYSELFITTVDVPVWRISPEFYWCEFSEENQAILDDLFIQDDLIVLNILEDAAAKGIISGNPEELTWLFISSLEGMFEKLVLTYTHHPDKLSKLQSYCASFVNMFVNNIKN